MVNRKWKHVGRRFRVHIYGTFGPWKKVTTMIDNSGNIIDIEDYDWENFDIGLSDDE